MGARARVTELVDVADLNSAAPQGRVGSNPTPGTAKTAAPSEAGGLYEAEAGLRQAGLSVSMSRGVGYRL